jgi:phosphate uptake regulator
MNLTNWQKEDIEDLLEEYPELTDMTDEELVIFSRKLYWKAQGLYDEVNRLESQAETVTLYMQTRGK